MIWIPIILAIVALAGAAGCLWYRQRLGQEIALMSAIATSRAADVAGIADALVRLLSDRALAERLGAQALEDSQPWRYTAVEYADSVAALVARVAP